MVNKNGHLECDAQELDQEAPGHYGFIRAVIITGINGEKTEKHYCLGGFEKAKELKVEIEEVER